MSKAAADSRFPTPMEVAWITKYMGAGDGLRAAEEIGITGDTPKNAATARKNFVHRALRKASVRKLIDRKLERIAAAAGMKQGKELAHADLLDEVLALARTPISQTGDRMNGQISAYELAAKMAGFITNKVEINDVTKRLQGKSAEELEFIGFYARDPVSAEEIRGFLEKRKLVM